MHETGGPDVLRWEEVDLPPVKPGQVMIRHTAVGFNMVDTYIRKGLYPADLPLIPGGEAAGVIEDMAGNVEGYNIGDRIAYVTRPGNPGACSERRVIDAQHIFMLPDGVSDEIAAASLLKGLTAWVLLYRTYPVRAGETILVYAAAGGVGSIMCQWARHIGARVIGVVGSDDKVRPALDNGCESVINRNTQDITRALRELTDGRGVPVVYDSLGKDTFEASLDCLQPTGLMVSYGNATGPVEPISILTLMQKGSLFLTRPQFFHYLKQPGDLEQGVNELFEVIQNGTVEVRIGQRFPLQDTAKAHAAAESARTTGSTVLIP